MDYPEWVERVLAATVEVRAEQHFAPIVFPTTILRKLGFDAPQSDAEWKTGPAAAMLDALEALQFTQFVLDVNVNSGAMITDAAEEAAHAGLRTQFWPEIFAASLTPRAATLLDLLVDLSHHEHDVFASSEWAGEDEAKAHAAAIPELSAPGAYDEAMRSLVRHRFAQDEVGQVRPTYRGLVRAVGNEQWQWEDTLRRRRDEWERPYTEFKRELDLDRVEGKEKLVRSCVAMANTIAHERRLLIVGFDPRTHEFTTSVNRNRFDSDRIEQILAHYAAPTPDVILRYVRFDKGTAGVLEVVREPRKVPYRVVREIGPTEPGPLVRHGTHSVPPTNDELASLISEGNAARGTPAPLKSDEEAVAPDTSDAFDEDEAPDARRGRAVDELMERFYREEAELDRLASLDDPPGVTVYPVRTIVASPSPPMPMRFRGLPDAVRRKVAAQVEQQRVQLVNHGKSEIDQLWRLTSSASGDEQGWRHRVGEWEKRVRDFEAEWNWDERALLAKTIDRGEARIDPDTVPRPAWRAGLVGRIQAGIEWLEAHPIRG